MRNTIKVTGLANSIFLNVDGMEWRRYSLKVPSCYFLKDRNRPKSNLAHACCLIFGHHIRNTLFSLQLMHGPNIRLFVTCMSFAD
jgi:hypothetical protein